MFFFMRKKEVVLDCFTYLHEAYEYCKIDHAIKFIPQWWKDTPKEIDNADGTKILSIKNCHGLMDYYKTGIIIPSWFELQFFMREKNKDQVWYKWKSSSDKLEITNHYSNQFYGFAGEDGINLKIQSTWQIKCKEDIKFTFNSPAWNSSEYMKYFYIMPGVVDFKYQHGTNINIFYKQDDQEREVLIRPKQPLVIMHPMTERKIKLRHHLIDEKEWYNIMSYRNLFITQNYKEIKQLKNGCPFHK
jgi:hypothetical protein